MQKNKWMAGMLLALAAFAVLPATPAISEVPPEDASLTTESDDFSPPGEPQATARQPDATPERAMVQSGAEKRPHVFQADVLAAARAHALPADFFQRLIWQESRFKPYAVSKAGALGIAQFMPGTAQWRGLADPFNPSDALHESARWLRELWGQFGNLGLAAAAYNAGPGRVSRWLAGRSSLPSETRAYVKIITGEPAERWSGCAGDTGTEQGCPPIAPRITLASASSTDAVVPQRPVSRSGPMALPPKGASVSDIDAGPWGPWGLQLAGDWSQARVLSEFKKIQTKFGSVLGNRKPIILRGQMAGRGSATWYRVRVAEATRERAVSLCAKLESAGGSCLVLRN